MSSSSQGTPGQYRSTPLSCDSSGSSRKRRIVETEHETSSTSITLQNLSSTYSEYFSDGHGGVEIYQVDVDGKYMKLYNGSDKVHSSLHSFLKICYSQKKLAVIVHPMSSNYKHNFSLSYLVIIVCLIPRITRFQLVV